jgi:hypothetical protein
MIYDQGVGWVKQRGTQRCKRLSMLGFTSLHPTYGVGGIVLTLRPHPVTTDANQCQADDEQVADAA